MTFWESLAGFCVVLLAVYGCAQAIRHMCLWLTRCPQCVECCRLAIPQGKAQLVPLVRCLQSQAIWDESAVCRHTLVVLPPDADMDSRELRRVFEESPAVIPVTYEDLVAMVAQIIKEN